MVTVVTAIVLFFAGLVLASDLFDVAAIHRKKTNAFKTLGALLVAKEAVEAKIPYLSAAASPQNLGAFNAMKAYLVKHFLIGDAVQVRSVHRLPPPSLPPSFALRSEKTRKVPGEATK